MNKKNSYIKKLRKLLDPETHASDQNKNQLIFRNEYIELIKALTLFIYKELADNYDFLEKNKRYYLLIPVLAFISGEWATYIVNYLYRFKEISPKDIDFLKNNTKYFLENNSTDLKQCTTYRDNTDTLKNSFFIRVFITHILLNKNKYSQIKKLLDKNIPLKKFKYSKNSNSGIKNFLRNIKSSILCGYKNLSHLKILVKTSFKDLMT